MARADPQRSAQKTKLARLRVKRGLGQRELELASGVQMRTLQRLEANEIPNPYLGYLVNLAIALDASLEDVIEDSWLVYHEEIGWEEPRWSGGDPRGHSAKVCRRSS